MVTSTSKNNAFICTENTCESRCQGCQSNEAENVQPNNMFLRQLWINIKLFFETDKWEPIVTFKVGDSYIVRKMDDIESQWRNKSIP